MSTFGERLKSIRLSKKMSQEKLAEILGTSKQVISRYENNKRVPSITVAVEYANKLSVPVEKLIDNNIETKKPQESELTDPAAFFICSVNCKSTEPFLPG